MVRSFSLSNNKNSIWRGKEYADLRYKKTVTTLVEGTVIWWWQRFQIFRYPPSMTDRISFSIVLFLCHSPFLSATYVSLNCIWGFNGFFVSSYGAPYGFLNIKLNMYTACTTSTSAATSSSLTMLLTILL